MDARIAVTSVFVCLYISLTGCQALPGSSPVQPATTPPKTDSAAAAASEDVETAGDISPELESVRNWMARIERVDDLHSRVSSELAEGNITPAKSNSYEDTFTQAVHAGGAENAVDDSTEVIAGNDLPAEPLSPAPVLGPIEARTAAQIIEPIDQKTESQASANAPASASNMPVSLQDFAEQWLTQPSETSFRGQLDQRLLLVLAGKYENARTPLEMVTQEQQQMAKQFVEALIVIREGHGGDPEAEANRVLTRVESLADSLVPLSELRIPALELTRAVRGFGQYDVFKPAAFPTGSACEFVVYCEIENFLSRPLESGGFESQFSMKTAILNRAGDVVLEINDEHIADKCHTRRHDCFIPRLVHLPATLSPGEYVVKITIIDKIGAKVAEKRTTFRIIARSS